MAVALMLFLGPGYGLLGAFVGRRPGLASKLYGVVLSFTLSVSFWAACLAWIHLFNLRLSAVPVWIISLAGWGLGLVRLSPWKEFWPGPKHVLREGSSLMLLVVLMVIVLAGLWGVRDEVAGAGSDSYHHTLFASMILDRGSLPENYQPVTDLVVTFTYHFGYHTVVAVLGWLSGISVLRIVLITGAVWVALSALSVAFLVEVLTGSRWGAVFAAIVTGLACIFPTHMLNWGRYPQLTGLILLPVWMGLMLLFLGRGVWNSPREGSGHGFETAGAARWGQAVLLSLLSAGIGFSHYRVALMTLAGFLALLPFFFLAYLKKPAFPLWQQVKTLAFVAAGCLILFSPWAWHVAGSLRQGFPLVVDEFAPVFFQFSRLGSVVLNFPTNAVVLVLSGIAVLAGIARRSWVIFWLLLWGAVLWFFSHPRLAAFFMDRISVIISFYIPLAVAVGWLAAQIERAAGARRALQLPLFAVMSLGLLAWSAPHFLDNIAMGESYLQPDDVAAAGWIQKNTPEDAYFMVNLFHFPFSPDLIVSPDGGYWLPLTAGRNTVSIPMSYMPEKFRSADGIDSLKALDQLEGDLCSPEAVRLLGDEGVTHVYLGSIGGKIRPENLMDCPVFEMEYNYNSVYVFRFDPSRAAP